MGDPLQPSRRTAVRAGAWAVPVVTVAAAAPALAASSEPAPWIASDWRVRVNPIFGDGNLVIRFLIDGGQTVVPSGASLRVWVQQRGDHAMVELVVSDWNSTGMVQVWSDDVPAEGFYAITVEITVQDVGIHTLTSPEVPIS